jgi:hypothetical protein
MSEGTYESAGFIVGVDLGQSSDYTALCVVERVLPAPLPPVRVDLGYGYFEERPAPDTRAASYHVRHLERPPLGTRYPTIVARAKELLGTPPLTDNSPLVVDRTGVGAAVTDMFAAAGMRPYAVTITGGDEVIRDGTYHVKTPKRELVGNLVMLFQTGRLKIAEGLAEGPVLVNELANFRVKINLATGHDSYEAWRESVHDDLVLAVALACWHGEDAKKREIRFLFG